MNTLLPYLHTYTLCLLRPRAVLDWLHHGVGVNNHRSEDLPQPELVGQLGISWAMAVVQGIARLMLANLMVQLFVHFQNDNDFFYSLIDTQDALFPYYVLLFTTALDLVFFPILTLVMVEFWNFILRVYAKFLGIEADRDEVARDITTVALSSNFFLVLPIIGPVFQQIAWLYLLYVGCRHRLGATRTLAIVILISPTVFMLMAMSTLVLMLFYLFS